MKMKKIVAMLLAVVMIVAVSVVGTIAWLMDSTDPVVNTFSSSDIEISLTETFNTDTDSDNAVDAWKQKMVPGAEYTKDPVVSVDGSKTDVDCYLFVRFLEENNPAEYLTYSSLLNTGNGWNSVDGTTDVWYRIVKVSDGVKSWHLLDGDKITVKNSVTKQNMDNAVNAKLTYEAYAIQLLGFENNVTGAWTQAYAQNSNT